MWIGASIHNYQSQSGDLLEADQIQGQHSDEIFSQAVLPNQAEAGVIPAPSFNPDPSPSAKTFDDVLSTKKGIVRQSALRDVGRDLASVDLEGALTKVQQLDGLVDQKAFLEGIMSVWAISDPESAFRYASSRSSLALAEHTSGEVLEIIGRTNPQLAARLVSGVASKALRENLARGVAEQFAGQAPRGAADWALALPDSTSRNGAIVEVARVWAETAPAEALAWANTISDSRLRAESTRAAIVVWAENETDAALGYTSSISDSDLKTMVVEDLSRSVGFHKPVEIFSWLLKQPDSDYYPGEIATVVSYWTENDPTSARAAVLSLPEKYRYSATASLAGTWASNEPLEAIDWVEAMDDGELREEAMRAASAMWAQDDPDSALARAREIDKLDLRDVAIYGVAEAVNNSNPYQAFRIAKEIVNPQLRFGMMEGVLMQLSVENPDAVEALLSDPMLSPDERQMLMKSGTGLVR